jgi:glycosyltransferase involved in cell wall biosynthesis
VGDAAEKMRGEAGIYDPYLDTLGGGERYMLTIADCLLKKRWTVDIFWDLEKTADIQQRLKQRFNLNLEGLNFVDDIFSSKKSLLEKWQITKKYDLIFHLSDGSIPLLFGKKNIVHFQIPFHDLKHNRLWEAIKLQTIDNIICNSDFTKRFIDREYKVNSQVIYPPIAVNDFRPGKKENIILSVARFSALMQFKRHDILIDSFSKISRLAPDWRLILAGGTEVGKGDYLKRLQALAIGLPIEIIESPSFEKIKALYAQAKVFWLASGYGVDENKYPERMEHFGISVVEGMAAGVVPIVVNKGGPKEVVVDDRDGLLWNTEKELAEKTLWLIKNQKIWLRLSGAAQKRAKLFSQNRFCHETQSLVS